MLLSTVHRSGYNEAEVTNNYIHNMSSANKTVMWVVFILVIIGVVWVVWDKQQGGVREADHGGAQQSSATAQPVLSTAATDTSSAALDSDTAAIDAQLNGLNSDASAVDQSVTSAAAQQ